jgi:hypothetical protein
VDAHGFTKNHSFLTGEDSSKSSKSPGMDHVLMILGRNQTIPKARKHQLDLLGLTLICKDLRIGRTLK